MFSRRFADEYPILRRGFVSHETKLAMGGKMVGRETRPMAGKLFFCKNV